MRSFPPLLRLCFAFLLLASVGRSMASEPAVSRPRVVGYYTEWSVYDRKFDVTEIPAAKLTHLNYAFAKIERGECALFDAYAAVEKTYPGDKWEEGALRGNFHQLQLLKEKHPHLQTLISVGGWTASSHFSDVALTPESRARFAASCVKFLEKYGFDGIDLDWEYPVSGGLESNKTRAEDKQNYTLLLAEVRRQFTAAGKKTGRHFLLTIAAPASPDVARNLELDKLHAHVDWINLMTYDFHGSWERVTNHHAPLFAAASTNTSAVLNPSIDNTVKHYLGAGVPRDQLVVGMPFYGRGWSGVKNANRGMLQPASAMPPKGTWEPGLFDYGDLAKNYLAKFERHRDANSHAPWLFERESGVMISYDDAESLRTKAEYVKHHQLGGVMIWELSADDADHTLLNALRVGLQIPGSK